jgi:hypothetical protein
MGGISRLNNIYDNMKQRCYNPNRDVYKYYGGRGIKICDEWNNRERVRLQNGTCSKGWLAFKKWALENGYQDNLTIDRIDPNGNYEPSNCRWVTMKVQSNNLRNNVRLTYKGRTQTIHEWCDELNLNYYCIRDRICRKGWDVTEAFETKENISCHYLTYNGKTQTIREWAKETGIKENTLTCRLKYGWTVERALSEKLHF